MEKTFPYAYIRGTVCDIKNAVIPIQAKVIQYGLGVFTGIRGHYNPKTKIFYLFRLKDHFERLQESAKITGMKFKFTYPVFEKTILDLIKKNKVKEDIYLRITLYAASTKLTPRFDNDDDDVAIYMISLKNYFHSDSGLNVCISSWRRVDDDAISTKAKVTGLYANSGLAKTEAVQNGYDEAIFLNRDGNVCEASGANIFGVKNGTVYTPPLSANNLNGITRRSVIEMMKDLKIEFKEEEIDRSTLYTFDELFFTGTAARITPVSFVDKRIIGNGKEGAVTKLLKKMFDEIVTGANPKYKGWLTAVY